MTKAKWYTSGVIYNSKESAQLEARAARDSTTSPKAQTRMRKVKGGYKLYHKDF
jgi:hypothetical protein